MTVNIRNNETNDNDIVYVRESRIGNTHINSEGNIYVNASSRPNDFSSVATVEPDTYVQSTISAAIGRIDSDYTGRMLSLSAFNEFRDEMYERINYLEKKCDDLTQMVLYLQTEKTNRKHKKDDEVNVNDYLL